MSFIVCVYWCPVCKLYHLDISVEFINAEPYHRSSDGSLHRVQKAKSAWMN